ncbi:hypothetical protein M513_11321 [Trichuris suis]|uniref:Uncharacterized protein n=1 Tax=Trichuris suis TaxID=68888 RepID=A0A085LS25_9BILA|nr:hypothetical protein M513_11321 [Trichuris suis]
MPSTFGPDVVSLQPHTLFIYPTGLMKVEKGARIETVLCPLFLLNITIGFDFIPLTRHDSITVK